MESIKCSKLTFMAVALSLSMMFSGVCLAKNKQYDRIVVFGTSLSDPGNAFSLLSSAGVVPHNVPPYYDLDEFLVPNTPYSRGGHHFTNGATWVEQLARGMGLSGNVRPALSNTGTQASNYAVGGARAASDGLYTFDLMEQLAAYVADFDLDSSDSISPETLVVIEMGGNDIRDAILPYISSGGTNTGIITAAANEIAETVNLLYVHGARKFLLAHVPDVGTIPALNTNPFVAGIASLLTNLFNSLLDQEVGILVLPDADVKILHLDALMDAIITQPGDYSFSNVDSACVEPGDPPDFAPFKCKNPDSYLFWDGVHPTKAGHDFMAQEAVATLLGD